MTFKKIRRRDFLQLAGVAILGGSLNSRRWLDNQVRLVSDPNSRNVRSAEPFLPDAEVTLTAVEKTAQILPGTSTRVLGYDAQLVSGSGVMLVEFAEQLSGPDLADENRHKIAPEYAQQAVAGNSPPSARLACP